MTGSVLEATREVMRRFGLTTVFGNPGTTEVPFLSDWPDDFHYVLGLQESVVVAMADAYAQLTRRPALVNLHSAGGVGHGLGAVFSASRNNAAVIVLAGQQARSMLGEEPFLGAPDATTFPKPHVRWSHEPSRAQEVPAALARAYRHAAQPPRGPVFLSVPVDDWNAPAADVELPEAAAIRGTVPHPDAVDELVTALWTYSKLGSNAPVTDDPPRVAFVAGGDVDADGAVDLLVTLAEGCRAAVFAAPMSGRCAFPEDHPLFAGFLPPERRALGTALSSYDQVIVLGAPAFTYHVLREGPVPDLPPTYLVSEDPDVLARAPHGRGILASPGLALDAVIRALNEAGATVPLGGPGSAGLIRPPAPEPSGGLTADLVYATLSRLLPDDSVVVEETPSLRGPLHDHLPIRSRDGGFLTTASGSLGFGIAATVGAALARPTSTVVGVIGDGSAMYGIQALWTAAREGTHAVFIILDNAEYAAVRLLGEAAGGTKLPGTKLGGIDFVPLARSMGCAAQRVDDAADLAEAISGALNSYGPTLLHIPIGGASPELY